MLACVLSALRLCVWLSNNGYIQLLYMNERFLFTFWTEQGEIPYRGGVDMPNRWFDESMILEKNDGTLQMLTRRKDGIGEAFSHDGGRTWGDIGKFCLGGPNSRFHIRKLHSGHILLINHWSPDNRFDTPLSLIHI